jgi:hypothetical protein
MNANWIKGCGIFLVMVSVLGCSKPESKIVGKWKSETEVIEFRSNKTGVVHLGTQRNNLPSDVEFRWSMIKGKQFKVEMIVPGAVTPPTGRGKLESNDTLVFEDDVLKRMK